MREVVGWFGNCGAHNGMALNVSGQAAGGLEWGVLRTLGFGDNRLAAIKWDSWKPVWVLCRFDLKPDADKGEYLAKTRKVIGAVRAEPGCLEYRLLGDCQTDWDKPQRFGEGTFWMLEKWGSVVELKAHLDTPHMKAFGPSVRSMRSNATFHVLEDVIL